MISKKGNKSNRTVMMENAVYDYFEKSYGIQLKHEVEVGTGIADFAGAVTVNGKYVDAIVVEIKQVNSDFYSGRGLNFVGLSNYLAVPSELVGFAICFLRDRCPNGDSVGVIEVCNNGLVRTVTYPRKYSHNQYGIKVGAAHFIPYHLLHSTQFA